MNRVHVALLAVLIGSSLFLVKTAYEWRRLFSAVERVDAEGLRIEQEFKRLDAERRLQATNQRVEREAQARLRMRVAQPSQKFYVIENGTGGTR